MHFISVSVNCPILFDKLAIGKASECSILA